MNPNYISTTRGIFFRLSKKVNILTRADGADDETSRDGVVDMTITIPPTIPALGTRQLTSLRGRPGAAERNRAFIGNTCFAAVFRQDISYPENPALW